MLANLRHKSAILFLAAALSATAACSDDDGPTGTTPAALVDSWDATSFVIQGTDLIALGMSIEFLFNADGDYVIDVGNDQVGLCDPDPSCQVTGDFTATATQITFDPGTTEAETINYSISGNVLTVTGTLDGSSVTATFNRS